MNCLTYRSYLLTLGFLSTLSITPAIAQQSAADQQIQADVQKTLDKKQFRDVHPVVNDGVVKLTGTVPTYADKEDADKRTHHRKNVTAVDNEIQVAAGEVDDTTLRNKLAEKLIYDRVGYGTTAFNSITIGVNHGVVTLGGTAYGPVDKDSAVSLVANFRGVRDVVDNINVDPLSPMDDRIRIDEFRTIYGFPTLNKYAIDPAKPIRITVVNGNVTLTGLVDSQADKDTANIRANSVAGVFKVTNQLQVAGSTSSQK
jgi:hyperosmotically inducible protein